MQILGLVLVLFAFAGGLFIPLSQYPHVPDDRPVHAAVRARPAGACPAARQPRRTWPGSPTRSSGWSSSPGARSGGSARTRPGSEEAAMTVDFAAGAPAAGDLDVRWIHGAPAGRRRPVQVHRYDAHTYVLRQPRAPTTRRRSCTCCSATTVRCCSTPAPPRTPTSSRCAQTVDGLVERWLAAAPARGLPAGRRAHPRARRPRGRGRAVRRTAATTVVPHEPEAVRRVLRLHRLAGRDVRFDLGGRVLDVTGIPGHHRASIAVFDPWTGFLLTGDTVYPGRLYVRTSPRSPRAWTGWPSSPRPGRSRT